MIEITDELKEFYDAWIALSTVKRKTYISTFKKEIPTEEKLSFNQSNVNFGEEMSYDDFDDDYDEDY